MTCFVCSHPGEYTSDSLKYLQTEKKLCEKHIEEIKEITSEVPKKYILKTEPKTFLPPIPEKEMKNFQDREPGSDG